MSMLLVNIFVKFFSAIRWCPIYLFSLCTERGKRSTRVSFFPFYIVTSYIIEACVVYYKTTRRNSNPENILYRVCKNPFGHGNRVYGFYFRITCSIRPLLEFFSLYLFSTSYSRDITNITTRFENCICDLSDVVFACLGFMWRFTMIFTILSYSLKVQKTGGFFFMVMSRYIFSPVGRWSQSIIALIRNVYSDYWFVFYDWSCKKTILIGHNYRSHLVL